MVMGERKGGEGSTQQIAALKDSIRNVRETTVTPQGVSSLFRSSQAVAHDVMGLNPLASTVFAMSFGSAILREAVMPYSASIEHSDGSKNAFTLISNSELPRTISQYLRGHFNFNHRENHLHRGKLTDELRAQFNKAGVTFFYIDDIANVGSHIASEITPFDVFLKLKGKQGIDESKLTVEQFQAAAQRIPERPGFILDEHTFPEFMDKTGQWVKGRFEEILDNVVSGQYLREQEFGTNPTS